ncbi:hypothetical protein QQP08_027109 [Theobroma cacao]|nr:hypothetical protein QQP08_027109 [Theobroma cacao]
MVNIAFACLVNYCFNHLLKWDEGRVYSGTRFVDAKILLVALLALFYSKIAPYTKAISYLQVIGAYKRLLAIKIPTVSVMEHESDTTSTWKI